MPTFNSTFFDVSGNQLDTLDVIQNIHLKTLNVAGNQLRTLDISRNASLERLDMKENRLPLSQLAAVLSAASPTLKKLDMAPQRQVFFERLAGQSFDLSAWLSAERNLMGRNTTFALVTTDKAKKITAKTNPGAIKALAEGMDYTLRADNVL